MDNSDGEDSLNEIFEDSSSEIFEDVEGCVSKEVKEFLNYRDRSQQFFRLHIFKKFMHQSKNKYPLSEFHIENIPYAILDVLLEDKFGTDRWFGIPYLPERQQYNLVKEMQDFYYDALVERFRRITFSKCGNYVKSDYGEKLLLIINNHEDLFTIAWAKDRKYAVPYFDHMFKNHSCGVCREQFIENKLVFLLHCKHAFHFSCLDEWCKNKTNCPLCEELVILYREIEQVYETKCSIYGYKYLDIYLRSLPAYI